jgi:uncharacterized membrane protein
MIEQTPPIFFALGATLCFAYASTIFTEFSRNVSPIWMNAFKAFVACFSFWVTVIAFKSWITPPIETLLALFCSGALALMIGDIFMLHAMKDLGASRMLMIFGLQPFVLGLAGTIFFAQSFVKASLVGAVLMLLCLYTISLESFKKNGHWQARGMFLGLIAVLLDAVGIVLTRFGFDSTPGMSSAQGNAIRCLGAVSAFFLLNHFYYRQKERKISLTAPWSDFSKAQKMRVLLGSLMGTYISLMLYLVAVSKGQLSVVSSVAVTGPMFAGLFECVRNRKWPSIYLLAAFTFFIAGFWIFTQQ